MKKIVDMLGNLGLKVTGAKEVAPFTVSVYFVEGNDFFTKYFFTGPKNNIVSKHDGKFVLPVEPVIPGYVTGRLLEKDSFFLFKPLPTELEIDSQVYRIQYKKDVWGW